MLRVNPIKNVNNTLNSNQPVFKAGVQTNYGIDATPSKNIVENGLFTGFAGIIKDAFFSPQARSRAKSIEAGLGEDKKFDVIA